MVARRQATGVCRAQQRKTASRSRRRFSALHGWRRSACAHRYSERRRRRRSGRPMAGPSRSLPPRAGAISTRKKEDEEKRCPRDHCARSIASMAKATSKPTVPAISGPLPFPKVPGDRTEPKQVTSRRIQRRRNRLVARWIEDILHCRIACCEPYYKPPHDRSIRREGAQAARSQRLPPSTGLLQSISLEPGWHALGLRRFDRSRR